MLLTMFIITIVLMAAAGIYSIVITHNLLRILIAMEIVSKSGILLLLLGGSISGQTALAESFIIILIVAEVVVTAIGAALCIALHAHTGSLDISFLSKRKEGIDAE
jgi:multisubunit Na+/H+ antiporter MnhC subunit